MGLCWVGTLTAGMENRFEKRQTRSIRTKPALGKLAYNLML